MITFATQKIRFKYHDGEESWGSSSGFRQVAPYRGQSASSIRKHLAEKMGNTVDLSHRRAQRFHEVNAFRKAIALQITVSNDPRQNGEIDSLCVLVRDIDHSRTRCYTVSAIQQDDVSLDLPMPRHFAALTGQRAVWDTQDESCMKVIAMSEADKMLEDYKQEQEKASYELGTGWRAARG